MDSKLKKRVQTIFYGVAIGALVSSGWRYYEGQITLQTLSFNVASISFLILFHWKIAPSIVKWLDSKTNEAD